MPQGAARALSRTGLGGAPPTSPGGRAAELLGNLADSGPKGQTLCGAKKSQADVASAARAGEESAFRSATCAEEVRNMLLLLQDACLLSAAAGHLGVHRRDAWPRAARGDAGAATPKCGCSNLDDFTVAFRNAFEAIADAIVAELLLPQLFVLALPAKSGDVVGRKGCRRGKPGCLAPT